MVTGPNLCFPPRRLQTHALVSALIRDHETLFLKMPDWAPDTPPSDGGETEPSIQQVRRKGDAGHGAAWAVAFTTGRPTASEPRRGARVATADPAVSQVLAEYDSEEEEAGGTPGSRSPVTGRKSMSSNQPASPSRLRSSSTATDDPAALRQQLQEEKLTTARLQEKVRQLAAANNVLQSDAEREQVARISAEQRLNLLVSQMRALGVVMPNVPGITQDVSRASCRAPTVGPVNWAGWAWRRGGLGGRGFRSVYRHRVTYAGRAGGRGW